jgi:hypothetical protein
MVGRDIAATFSALVADDHCGFSTVRRARAGDAATRIMAR